MTAQVNTIVATGAGGTLAAIAAGVGIIGLAYITGNAVSGGLLTANTVSGLTGTSWQWKSNGTSVGGATGSTYTVQSGDVGNQITVVINGILVSAGVVIQ